MSIAELRTVYTTRCDSTPQGELSALEAIYRRAIERYDEAQEGGPAMTAPDDAKGSKHDRARSIIQCRTP